MPSRSNSPLAATSAPRRPAPTFLAIAVLALTLAVLSMFPAAGLTERVSAADRPTIVLVHGAWAGPGGWDQVRAALAKDGYETAAPALGLLDMPTDVATVRATLDAMPGDKILVGHSYGGAVMSQAAAGRTDVRGLVFTAAFAPDEGQSLLDLGAGYAPPAALALGHLLFAGDPPFAPTTIDPNYFRDDFAQDLNPKLASTLSAQQRPTGLLIFAQPAGPAAWHSLPSWYAVSAADRMVDPALQRSMAGRIGATTVEFDDASHAGGFTHYAARFVKLIEAAVAATR